jgi:hypothetical protein
MGRDGGVTFCLDFLLAGAGNTKSRLNISLLFIYAVIYLDSETLFFDLLKVKY